MWKYNDNQYNNDNDSNSLLAINAKTISWSFGVINPRWLVDPV